MPRVGRVVLPDYPHHIVQRGHNRLVVFAQEGDFEVYLSNLRLRQHRRGIWDQRHDKHPGGDVHKRHCRGE